MEKKHKTTEAQSVYERMIEIFFYGIPVEDLKKIVNKSFIGYGTAAHEFFLSINDLLKMAETQSEQLKNHPIEITRKPILSKPLKEGSSHLIVEEFHMHDKENDFRYTARVSTILEKIEEKWLVTHFHGSTPDSNVSEEESLPMEGLRRKNLELEEKIKERTRELETKNRQLEIEGALERIRAQAVAMKTSSDLLDIVVTMRNEFIKLGHEAQYFWHMMWLPETYEKAMTSGDGSKIGFVMQLPRHIHGTIPKLAKWEKSKKPTVVFTMTVDEAIAYVDKMVTLGDFQNIDPQAPSHDDIRHIGGLTFIMSRTTHGEIGYSLPGIVKSPPKEDIDILVKFASAFDLAHQRFLDLQKAETQARETQIELALEKVRSRSMAMHKGDELKEIIQVVYDQLVQLQVKVEHAGFILDYKENEDMHIWLADHNAVFPKIVLPYFDCAHWKSFIEAKKTGQNFFTNKLGFEEKNKFYEDLFQFIPDLPEETKTTYFGFEGLAISTVLLDNVGLYIENYNGISFSDEENAVLMRFGKVFQQAYTRFLDLQKAEAQAREAEIEVSLERIRSRSMAMHQSDELPDILSVLFDQFDILGINPSFTHLTLFDEVNETFSYRMSGRAGHRVLVEQIHDINRLEAWKIAFEHWKSVDPNTINCIDYPPEALPMLFDIIEPITSAMPEESRVRIEDFPNGLYTVQGHCKFGYLGFHHHRRANEEEKNIVVRFAGEFGRVYQRFLDLKKSEAQAKEAQIEAALERVRSQSMGMQSSTDLSTVTTEMFNQLRRFDGDLFATGIVFCDKHEGHVEQWHSIPNAGMMTPFIVPVDLDYIHQYRYDEWKKGTELFSVEIPEHFIKQHFDAIFKLPSAQIVLKDLASKSTPMPEAPAWEIDYGASFKNGYILVSALQPFKSLEILPRFAKVFEQAYTRFLDLQKAEAQALRAEKDLIAIKAAREKAEEALTELQNTQKQLIQSEKMASLGELTAGIAHEIQNPLNFVNNFSEVSMELLDEMKTELENGNLEDVKDLAQDVIKNLEKINHHGKRADGIVKGMLQHSRSSSSEKELTDINKLTDEYLRLAYHGLRAKDKSFNATLNTHFDELLEKIEVVPQDIGRVILNLITNGFYACTERSRSAVSEKKLQQQENYEPTVTVTTKKSNNNVMITVEDNGNGIPQAIIDKIFQPFFTTKPTGQGTGLGLSLSYDIVKAHGGSIKIESNENEGATFTIELPI